MAGRPEFLLALLRGGSPVLATATSELTEEVADPTPMRALRRIQHMAGPVDRSARDSLLLRATRYIALAPLAYRLIAVPAAFVAFASTGQPGLLPLAVATACAVALNLYGVRWLLRNAPFHTGRAARLLALDVAFAFLLNLAVASTVPSGSFVAASQVPGKYLLGTVALVTFSLGLVYGGAIALATAPLQVAMGWLGEGRFDLGVAFTGFGTLAGVLLTAAAALVLLGLGTRLALAYGLRNGRLAERAVYQRHLHDTVLQTLEAIARPGSADADRLRGIAREEADTLRRYLEAKSGAEQGPLAEKLTAIAAEMARDGLRAQLVLAEPDGETLSEVRQLAVRDAVREALRNTVKHAGTDKVLVRTEPRDGGIATVIRDHGSGFDAESLTGGFGISESIVARLADVGGTARIDSRPGGGTRVTLWVPANRE